MNKPNWGGATSRQRGREKLNDVIRWLAWFDYSDYSTLARMLGVTERGQTGFFARLRQSGFVEVHQVPGMRMQLLGLSPDGVSRAQIMLPEIALRIRRQPPAWVSLVHTLSIQASILRRYDDVTAVEPEKALSHLRALRLPDAVLGLRDGRRVALEVELNHKSTARIYHAFLSHVKNIHNKHYDSVQYIFPSEALARLYRVKFEVSPWPVHALDPKTRKLGKATQNFESASIIASDQFEFLVEGVDVL